MTDQTTTRVRFELHATTPELRGFYRLLRRLGVPRSLANAMCFGYCLGDPARGQARLVDVTELR